MALADSVPGVSGGTIAFLMGLSILSIILFLRTKRKEKQRCFFL